MKAYTRGQESFLYKIHAFAVSLVRLLCITIIFSFFSYILLLYWYIPTEIWSIQKDALYLFFKNLTLSNFTSSTDRFISYESKLLNALKPLLLEEAKIALLVGIGSFFILAIFFQRKGQKLLGRDHKRGSKLLNERDFITSIRQSLRDKIHEEWLDTIWYKRPRQYLTSKPQKYVGKAFCVNSKIWLPEFALNRHIGALGASGTGKTTLIKRYLDYCRQVGGKVLIVDINGEYASFFKRPDDIVLSLYDKRSEPWSFAGEKKVLPVDFAKFLVPSTSEANSFFWKGARSVLAELLGKEDDTQKLWEIISSGEAEIIKNVSSFAQSIIGKGGSGQASGIVGSTLLELSFLKDINHWPNSVGKTKKISLYDWVQNDDKSWVFLTFSDTDHEVMRPLLRLWINTTILGLLQRPLMNIQKLPPFSLIIDELSSVGKIELLPKAIDRARKYGGRVVLGYQSDYQLLDTYGKDAGSALKSGLGNRFIFRSTEPKEIRELSDFLGRVELREKNESHSFGIKHASERESVSQHDIVKNVVLDSEIKQLPDFHFYLSCLHLNPVRSRLNKREEKPMDDGYEKYYAYPSQINEKPILNRPEIAFDVNENLQEVNLIDEI